ncbi:MAG: squalene/phytoene synthase family protein [Gemmatimonadaceae bacterium]
MSEATLAPPHSSQEASARAEGAQLASTSRAAYSREYVAVRLSGALTEIRDTGGPELTFDGQLLRPMLSLAGADCRTRDQPTFWFAALAVQLAHEASLCHDDVVDQATTRRGRPTLAASSGVARALLEGDHLLTAAYCAAAATGSAEFVRCFARAVERTVAAEKLQGSTLGTRIDAETYQRVTVGKAGELMACALAAGSLINDAERSSALLQLGRDVGVVYQMLDDFLDYCTATDFGKPSLGDYCQGRWTWPLAVIPGARLGLPATELATLLHEPRHDWGGECAFERMAAQLDARLHELMLRSSDALPDGNSIANVLNDWRARLRNAVTKESVERRAMVRRVIVARAAATIGLPEGEIRYLGGNSISFRFASRLLPRIEAARIARVYAFCRFTDDIVDEPALPGSASPSAEQAGAAEMLREWVEMARAAYYGNACGLAIIDRPMSEMAAASVPFSYVDDLAAAMRMDIAATAYPTSVDLARYTYGAAGVVGRWIAGLAGTRDATVLLNAERMGHAMQLTNIVRDVGEDWQRGRLYLPADVLRRHGVTSADIDAMLSGKRSISDAYRNVLDEIIAIADEHYRIAFEWLPALPCAVQPCMAVAARVYRGIHEVVRENNYDNLRLRAHTTLTRKSTIAARALIDLRMARTRGTPASANHSLEHRQLSESHG